jgi:spore germination cell wall hydrolase CwlJ-like protein
MLALLGGLAKGAGTANKVRSATKMLPGRDQKKRGSALVERPKMSEFSGKAEKAKDVRPTQPILPSIDSFGGSDGPKEAGSGKGLKATKKKIDTIFQFIKFRSKKKEEFRKKDRIKSEKEKRKEKEKNKEKGIASKLVKGAKDRVLAPVKSLFDSILNIIGNLILAKIAMWAVDNPELFENILKTLATVADFIVDSFIKIVDIFAGLIDFGYDLVDGFKDWVEGTFGEDVAKQLDKLGPVILGFLNAAVAVATALLLLGKKKPPKVPDAKNKKKPRKPGQGPDPDINARKRPGITKSRGRRTGFKGALDRIADKNPFRKKPKVTGGDDFFSKAGRKIDELNPLSGGAKSVTTSGGKRTGLGGLKDRIDDLNPLKKKPKITGSGSKPGFFDNLNPFKKKPKVTTGGGGPSFIDRLKKLGGDTLELGKKGVKKLEQGADFVLQQGGRFGKFVSDQYKKVTEGLGEWAKKNSPKLTSVLDWLSEQKGVLGNVAKKFKPVLQKLGKYLPFIGDALGFGLDLLAGVDWRRALIRMITGLAIDAGFTTLMTALGVAAPFTGGASGLLATAIYGAYMATDLAAGGFGTRLGDKISDLLKIPMYAGDKALAEPKAAGSDKDVKNVTEKLNKKLEDDSEFAEKVKKTTKVLGPSPKGDTDKPKKVVQPKEDLVPTTTTKKSNETPDVKPQTSLIPTKVPVATLKGSEMDLFKRLVTAEAGGEGLLGMALVARSVLNRAGLIQSGKATTGTFLAKDSSVTGVIMGRNQYQPVSDGSINRPRSESQLKTAQDAIDLALKPDSLRARLKTEGLSADQITKLMASTGFRTGSAFNDPSQNVNVVKFKNHYFNTAGNPGLKAETAQVSRDSIPSLGDEPAPPISPLAPATSPSASSVSTLSSSSTSQSAAVVKPGDQGMIPLPLPVSGQKAQPSGGGAAVISGGESGLNSFYRSQLFGFLYKQG